LASVNACKFVEQFKQNVTDDRQTADHSTFAGRLLEVCWKFAKSLLNRVNAPLKSYTGCSNWLFIVATS